MNIGTCSLEINTRAMSEKKAELSLEGFVDADTAGALDCKLSQMRSSGVTEFLVDCSGVSYLSSHGVAVLVRHSVELQAGMGRMSLCGMDAKVRTIFDYLDLGDLLPVLESPTQKK